EIEIARQRMALIKKEIELACHLARVASNTVPAQREKIAVDRPPPPRSAACSAGLLCGHSIRAAASAMKKPVGLARLPAQNGCLLLRCFQGLTRIGVSECPVK